MKSCFRRSQADISLPSGTIAVATRSQDFKAQ